MQIKIIPILILAMYSVSSLLAQSNVDSFVSKNIDSPVLVEKFQNWSNKLYRYLKEPKSILFIRFIANDADKESPVFRYDMCIIMEAKGQNFKSVITESQFFSSGNLPSKSIRELIETKTIVWQSTSGEIEYCVPDSRNELYLSYFNPNSPFGIYDIAIAIWADNEEQKVVVFKGGYPEHLKGSSSDIDIGCFVPLFEKSNEYIRRTTDLFISDQQ